MMPAAKMMDPVMGVDVHLIQPPGPVPPLPVPHPFIGMLYDPMELAPFIGATVFVNGMPKATAGSEGKAVPPHIPIGGVFVPPPPGNECEMFMGSATVLFEGEPASYTALPALSCQSIGVPAPPRAKKKPKPIMKLPLSVVVPIPAGPPVLIGGPPTISLTVIGMKILMGAAGKAAKKLKKAMKASKKVKKVSDKIHKAAKKAMKKLGVPPSIQNKVHKAICTVTGHPVDVATGKVFTDNVDFELPGPIPLRWERTWYSSSSYRGPLGHGWHHAYDMALVEDGNAVAIRMGDGRPAAFPALTAGKEHYDRSEKLTLSRDDKGYFLQGRDRLIHRFSQTPTARGEQPLVSIANPSGHQIRFHYDSLGRLESIVDTAGRHIGIHSDDKGRITGIFAPHPELPGTRFQVMEYRYDGHEDMREALDALKQSWRFRFENHLLVEESNRNGMTFRFEYDTTGQAPRCVRTWGDGGIYDHKLTYDLEARTTVVEDSLGAKTTYHCSDAGLVVKTVDALGNESSTVFNEFNEIAETIDELGNSSAYEYDDRGDIVKRIEPDGATEEIEFVDGDPALARDALGGEWKWEYDECHRPVKRVDPLGHASEYHYQDGLLTRIVDASGQVSTLGWSPTRQLESVTQPGGATSRWEYDFLGRCKALFDPNGNAQRFQRDLLGRIRAVDEPDGVHREMKYDPEGNILKADEDGHQVAFRYEGLNRMVERSENGIRVEFKYDTEDRLVTLRNAHGFEYLFKLDPTGEVVEETGFDGLRKTYSRDAKGRMVETEMPGGLKTAFKYDAADQLLEVTHPDGAKDSYGYRADGLIQEASNEFGKLAIHRDALGRLVREEDGDYWVETAYDALGQQVETRSSLGAAWRVAWNPAGDPVKVEGGPDPKSPQWGFGITRDSLGLEIERTMPGGIRSKWNRDKLGRPLKHSLITSREFRSRDYEWGPQGTLKSLRDSRHGLQQFQHDPVGNLLWSEAQDGAHLFRLPDQVGNLFRTADKDDRVYGPAGQLLEMRGPQGTTKFEYDALGNLASKIEPGGKSWNYQWNSRGFLERVVRPDGQTVEFTYDVLGRRKSKAFRGSTVRWVWDGDVPLHEWVEKDKQAGPKVPEGAKPQRLQGEATLPLTWVFEPDSFSPMAKLCGPQTFPIVTDHLGSPVAMYDGEGKEVWSALLDIHGNPTHVKGDPEDCPFRFPGQYEDRETGLHYNRFRYFSPEADQYISQDPIGLSGGMGMYQYVHDVLEWMDPLGLAKAKVCGVTGLPILEVSKKKQPKIHANLEAAIKNGKPTRLTRVTKAQAKKNRRAALKGRGKRPKGKSVEEYPFASSKQGGKGAQTSLVPVSEQNSQGGQLSSFYRDNNIKPGDDFIVQPVP